MQLAEGILIKTINPRKYDALNGIVLTSRNLTSGYSLPNLSV